MMRRILQQQLELQSNDYSALERTYEGANIGPLVTDPYQSILQQLAQITLTASVVIPAWNSGNTLEVCLKAIGSSSFNRKYPGQLEVIVVDDGSTDETWELLERLRLDLHLKAVRQNHASRSQAQNTAIAIAEGDIIISCDADMVLAPLSIEELMKRHQLLRNVLLIGFRQDVTATDPRVSLATMPQQLAGTLPAFANDVRTSYFNIWDNYHPAGWPDNLCRDSDHLRRLGAGKQLYMPDLSAWALANLVFGALFSLRRADLIRSGGYDERFSGWGVEDTMVGAHAIALGNYILPVYSATGLHIAHGDRSANKWEEFLINSRLLNFKLRLPFSPQEDNWTERAKRRILASIERHPASGVAPLPIANSAVFSAAAAAAMKDPGQQGRYFFSLGRYEDAAAAFSKTTASGEKGTWALYQQARSLRRAGRTETALSILAEVAGLLPANAWPKIEWALALAAADRFTEAHNLLCQATEIDSSNPLLRFIMARPVELHVERARRYAAQGDNQLARWDYEAALAHDPDYRPALIERAALATCSL